MARSLAEKLADDKVAIRTKLEEEQTDRYEKEAQEQALAIVKRAEENPGIGEFVFDWRFSKSNYTKEMYLSFEGRWFCFRSESGIYHCKYCFDPARLVGMPLYLHRILVSEELGFKVEPQQDSDNAGIFRFKISW